MTASKTPRLPATLPEADWLPADLLAEVQSYNQAVEHLAAEAAGEGEAASRALALAADPSATFDALDEARHALESARLGKLLESRRLHARREAIAGRFQPAAEEALHAAEAKLAGRESYLRGRACKAGFGASIATIVENDSEASVLRRETARARALLARISLLPTGDTEAVAEIDGAIADWLGVAVTPEEVDLARYGVGPRGPEPTVPSAVPEPISYNGFGQGPQGDARIRAAREREEAMPGGKTLGELQAEADKAVMTGAPGTLASVTGQLVP